MVNDLVIAITPGEPSGIGPDVLLLWANEHAKLLDFLPLIFADRNLLAQRCQELNLNIDLVDYDNNPTKKSSSKLPQLFVKHIPLTESCQTGHLNPANARYVLKTIDEAVLHCLHQQCVALVTGPVQKSVINDAGISFRGHTEYLAEKTNTPDVVMMLMTSELKVALATTHLPLSAVPQAITAEGIKKCIRIINHDLKKRFAITQPKILVCGLNPHAGENGHLGTEEQQIIIPVLEQLRNEGIYCDGPAPADTAFVPNHLKPYDIVLCMYHDQGLPVLKAQGFDQAVNVTLGLPIIRTSVDHGTALNFAGTGQVNYQSFTAAINCALQIYQNQLIDQS